MVENQGNIPQAFTLTWQSPDDSLEFAPAPSQEFHIAPGEMTTAEFSAKPRSRPLFGRERAWPFATRVQAAGGSTRNLNGEVLGKPIIPSSVLTAILVAVLVIAAIVVLVAVLGGSPDEGAPPVADVTATPVEEGPAPTEPPPEEPPTEPPPEEPPTEPPPEEPPTEPPEEPPTEPPGEPPDEPPGEDESPCAPIAGILVLAPLLVIGKRERDERKAGK
jgi:outer membrane biosynthesis protein TonB